MSARKLSPGHGFGVRAPHVHDLLHGPIPVERLEVVTEDYLNPNGTNRDVLRRLRGHRPVTLHGVSLAVGSMDELNATYLAAVRALADEIEPECISDHLCWGTSRGRYAHDLLPLPLTEEALDHVVPRVVEVQERLGRQVLLENVSTYVQFAESEMTEWEFCSEVARRADCGLLLDVNNVYVNARNHGFDGIDFIQGVDAERVVQVHLAGHEDCGTHLLDTHAELVAGPVWELYEAAVGRLGPLPTLVEWDSRAPALEVLVAECARARAVEARALGASRESTAAEPTPSSRRAR